MNFFSILLGSFSLLFFLSCKEITAPQIDSDSNEVEILSYLSPFSPYIKDQSVDFFLKNPWYSYDQANHIIWPNFRVYGVRTNNQFYKVQFVDYYNNQSESGNYTVRYSTANGSPKIVNFSAKGCGNAFNNPDYEACLLDQEVNVYTYLNLETGDTWNMSDFEAEQNTTWHLAFKGTQVKLNSGNKGPGDVRLADLYLYGGFYPNVSASFQRLARESFTSKGLEFFNISFPLARAAYTLPSGIERVINEDSWYERYGIFHRAKSTNTWFVQTDDKNREWRFRILDIQEISHSNQVTDSKIIVGLMASESGLPFGPEISWSLPLIDNSKRLIRLCLDIDNQSIVECQNKNTDLIFSALNIGRRRVWRFNVSHGAYGPIPI